MSAEANQVWVKRSRFHDNYVYHSDPDCPYLNRLRSFGTRSRALAEEWGMEECRWCAEGGISTKGHTYDGGTCPLCGADYTGRLPDHLPCDD